MIHFRISRSNAGFMAVVCVSGLMSGYLLLGDDNGPNQWPIMGQNLANWRSAPSEHKIGVSNAASLAVKWSFTTGSDVSATPTASDNNIYFPDWAGNLYAVQANDGKLVWSRQISQYDNQPGAVSRVSPAIHGEDLIIGDTISTNMAHAGANIIAVNRRSGDRRWITQVESHPAAIITGSPVVANDVIYIGVSSNEEALAVATGYPCCSFRGSVVALDANTGRILWKTYMAPDNHGSPDGYSGNAVWQPPAIDPARGSLYVGTGNNYEVPDSVKTCIAQNTTANQPSCFAPDDFYDSAMALDLATGSVKWSRRLQGVDVWTVACIRNPNPVSCPLPSSPDYDLSGSGPNLVGGIVGFGQKSGIYWALRPQDGSIVWSTTVGPGSTLGGIEWGTATDGQRIYVAITNAQKKPYPLISGQTVTSGAFSALDVNTGKILWQTADPDGAFDMGAVSVANGVVYAPSFSGKMHALNASTGAILFSFQSGGSVICGPSIVNGTVFWGSGYRKISPGTGNNKVFAFSTPDDGTPGQQ
jgi:polyvinyl alcohol dehydrogenase (cytochrome)